MNAKNQRLFGALLTLMAMVGAVLLAHGLQAHDSGGGIAIVAAIMLVIAAAFAIQIAEFKRRRK
ncbi:hypothetical protein [Leifsonella bigeumensis]|uniref:hypothetical protein n=1 Tax=Leifsonella bigeumensis TaxID=433643 RepID=UPI0031CF6294